MLFTESLFTYVIYLTMPSVEQTKQHQMTELLMNNEWERIWKKVIVA
jgi:hypothetical protein